MIRSHLSIMRSELNKPLNKIRKEANKELTEKIESSSRQKSEGNTSRSSSRGGSCSVSFEKHIKIIKEVDRNGIKEQKKSI